MADEKINNLVSALEELFGKKDETITAVDTNFLKLKVKNGSGVIWTGGDYTKQFVFNSNPDRFFSSESIDIAKDRSYLINSVTVLTADSLGSSVTKSNLRSLGPLQGLIVNGSVAVDNNIYYDKNTKRFGIGTDQPNATLNVVDEGIDFIIGSRDYNKAKVGLYNSSDLEIITDNTARITIEAGGNIELGNKNFGPIKVNIHGTVGIDVNSIDIRSKLHVNGAIKFNNVLHTSASSPPSGGSYNHGDIVWNSNPQQKSHIGWVCVRAGNPGVWCPFGEIK